MSLNAIEQTALSYYLATGANDLTIATRWYPHGDLILVIEDKIAVATRKFGRKVSGKAKAPAEQLLDTLIERGAFETKTNEFGGSMHQFQDGKYREVLKDLQANDPLVQEADGPEYWEAKFGALVGA
ncbi:hypothetical protein [Stakelama tenebrarum]|uniref:Uncharacterized protein n=1 Tax=Stakelama tenebrarum TaxID=2711215 RepID=A0A6G6Y7C2_9SPHN|nr:hypothetical protein [Sphingosinithalassobacter tenebrarum]QIG80476.1 hypothetical protein G5C33_12265 [Sphingosinithalassobacter tenebrarum]